MRVIPMPGQECHDPMREELPNMREELPEIEEESPDRAGSREFSVEGGDADRPAGSSTECI